MNTAETAAALETEPKVLRRFLRADVNYANAGAGGRYEFTDSDLPQLRERFALWSNAKAEKKPRVTKKSSGDVRLPTSILGRRMYASERTKRDAISRARVDRLEEALMARGLHISQMKDLASR